MKNGIKIGIIWAIALLMLSPIGGMPVGNVMAGDIGSYSDNSTNITCIVHQGPIIQAYGLLNSTNVNLTNDMLDVQVEYHFYAVVNQSSGWSDMEYVNITAWYDNNDDSAYNYNVTAGANLNFKLVYDNTTGTASISSPYGNVLNVHGTETVIDTYTHNITIYFTLDYQMRHAPGDGNWSDGGGPGWNDLDSWNFRINATSVGGYATKDDEFGIYKYTYVAASGDPSVTTSPGTGHTTNVMSPVQKLTFRTNDVFWLNVTIGDLTSGSNSITSDNVWVRTNNGTVTTDTQFPGPGGGTLVLYGTAGAGNYSAAYADGSEELCDVTWSIDVPLGTPVGTYTSGVTYLIEQP